MAKHTINYACGHQAEVQLYGKLSDREKRIAWLESQDCEECRRAKAQAAVEAAKKARGLKDFAGTPRQTAWADAIRERAYKCLDILVGYANNEQAKQMVEYWKSKMEAMENPKWWIDSRYSIPEPANPMEIIRAFSNILK